MTEEQDKKGIDHLDLLDALLAIHASIIVGALLNEAVAEAGLKLPLFVTCLFAGIILTNLVPKSFPRISGREWPTRTPAVAPIADGVSLGSFLAMSLMSMQLWTLIDLAGPIFTILAAQFALAVAVNIFIVFRLMGANYDAAVVCSGFGADLITVLDAHRDGQYGRRFAALWRVAYGLYHRAADRGLFHRPGQRTTDPVLPRPSARSDRVAQRCRVCVSPAHLHPCRGLERIEFGLVELRRRRSIQRWTTDLSVEVLGQQR